MSSPQNSYAAQRKYPRANIQIKADYRLILPNKGKEITPLETQTLGGGGLMFYSSHPIDVGTYLALRLFLEEKPIECITKVVWMEKRSHSKQTDPVFAIGIQYIVISQEDLAKITAHALAVVQLQPSPAAVYTQKYPRVNLKLRADSRILLPEKDQERIFLNVKTVGGGGLMFVSLVPLSIGTELQMRLYYYTDEIDCIGRVVWTNPVLENQTPEIECGLMFTEISDVHRTRINHIVSLHLGKPDPSV